MIRYVRILKDDGPLRARLEELAAERRRFGFRRLAVLLRRDGVIVNIKRVLRIYREANLQVRKRVRRRVALGRGTPAPIVSRLNQRWSLDFVHDTLSSGRRIRTLNIVDDFSRECLAIEVDTSLSGQRVVRTLDAIASVRGYPETIVLDNGTELTSLAMLCWARDRRVRLHFIQPGKPAQNASRRELQRSLSRRVPERTRVLNARRSPRAHRRMAPRLQREPTTSSPPKPYPRGVRSRAPKHHTSAPYRRTPGYPSECPCRFLLDEEHATITV